MEVTALVERKGGDQPGHPAELKTWWEDFGKSKGTHGLGLRRKGF